MLQLTQRPGQVQLARLRTHVNSNSKMYTSDKFSEMVYKGYFTYYNEEYEQTDEQ